MGKRKSFYLSEDGEKALNLIIRVYKNVHSLTLSDSHLINSGLINYAQKLEAQYPQESEQKPNDR